MKRQEKYPNTRWFQYHNANPSNAVTSDCVVRAVSVGAVISYRVAFDYMRDMAFADGYFISDEHCYGRFLVQRGLHAEKQPRKCDGKKYTGREFCEMLNVCYAKEKVSVVAKIGRHHLTAICWVEDELGAGYRIIDTWNCSGGCIGKYWWMHCEYQKEN